MPGEALLTTTLPFPLRRGKVRDVYDLGDALLFIATDRISAYDVIMPNGIPGKGRILTALTLFWFEKFRSQFENHLITADVAEYPPAVREFRDQLEGRSMLVRKAQVIPIECVARGYLAGSGWKEYQQTQTVCGIRLPPGLRQCDKLPAPIFTPATKEESGHDINISFDEAVQRVGLGTADTLRERTLRLYTLAADYAASRGVIIADTKFEFGIVSGPSSVVSGQNQPTTVHGQRTTDNPQIILIDEVLTPDSSRFWPVDQYQPGRDQPSFDKQFVRNYLETLSWDKTPPGPVLPPDVVEGTRRRYLEAYERLTGGVLRI
jgi:phosphoribosylaminoimidazole-succinocarboxamide synthase